MGRPPLVLRPAMVIALLSENRMSVREASRFLGCSRWVVRRAAERLGIEVRDDVDAASLKRYLTPEPESMCLSGGCEVAARGYCPNHVGVLALAIEGRICASPRCPQQPRRGDAWCYAHEKAYGGSS